MTEDSKEIVRYWAHKPPGSSKALSDLIARPDIQASIAKVIPKHLTPERIVKMMLMAVSREPKLLKCTQASLLKCAMTGAELGLDFSGTLGRAYLVPFGNEATFIPGYLGLADLARNSGDIVSLDAQCVYKQDGFKLVRGLSPLFEHEEDLYGAKLDDEIVGAYFIAQFISGGHHIEWMTRGQILAIRARSKAASSGPWVTDFAAMCRKTVMRRGLKFCPLSTEAQAKIAKAEEDEFIQTPLPSIQHSFLDVDDLQPGKPGEHTDVRTPLKGKASAPKDTGLKCKEWFQGVVAALKENYSIQDKGVDYGYQLMAEASLDLDAMPDKGLSAFQNWVFGTMVPEMQAENWLPQGEITI